MQVVAFPSISELFGTNVSGKISEIEESLDAWAESQAHNTGADAAAFREVLRLQANIIINESGKHSSACVSCPSTEGRSTNG